MFLFIKSILDSNSNKTYYPKYWIRFYLVLKKVVPLESATINYFYMKFLRNHETTRKTLKVIDYFFRFLVLNYSNLTFHYLYLGPRYH